MDHFRKEYQLNCAACERAPQKREILGCGKKRKPDNFGKVIPFVGAGLSLLQCPISYAFHNPLSAGLLDAYQDRRDGIVPPWGQGSLLYHDAMSHIHASAKEREREILKEATDE